MLPSRTCNARTFFYHLAFLMLSLVICLSACQNSAGEGATSSASPLKAQPVEILLHPQNIGSTLGLPINLRVKMTNPNTFDIEFEQFISAGLNGSMYFAFTGASAAYLIGPDGHNLLAPYRQPPSYFEEEVLPDFYEDRTLPGLRVGAESEYWFSLPLWAFVDPREAGEYTFWLELQDNIGNLHHSNEVQFQLAEIEPSHPAGVINLHLQFDKSTYTATDLQNLNVQYEYTFINHGDNTISLLHKLAGFNSSAISPIYRFTIIDEAGRHVPIMLSDVTRVEPNYKAEDFIHLRPGVSYSMSGHLPHFPGMHVPGEYRVHLTYLVFRHDIITGEPADWEDTIFVGRLESNEVLLKIVDE